MPTKKKNDVVAFVLENGPNVIAQFVSSDETWCVIMNAIGLSQSEDGDRLNMNPLLRYSKKDTEIKIPMTKINAMYTPTDGLTEEYIAVFVEETKSAVVEELEEVEVG